MTDDKIPDDLSGIGDIPRMRHIGDINPAAVALYDQLVKHVSSVGAWLLHLTFVAQCIPTEEPGHDQYLEEIAQATLDTILAMDPRTRVLLINMLTNQVAMLVEEALRHGYLPRGAKFADEDTLNAICDVTTIPRQRLDEMMGELMRGTQKGGVPQPPPVTDPAP